MKLSDYSDQRTKLLDKIINTLGKDYKAFEDNPECTCSKMFAITESLQKIDGTLADKTRQIIVVYHKSLNNPRATEFGKIKPIQHKNIDSMGKKNNSMRVK